MFRAIPAGDLKIPLPIVEPTSTATALKRPNFRGSSIQRKRSILCAFFGGLHEETPSCICSGSAPIDDRFLAIGAAGVIFGPGDDSAGHIRRTAYFGQDGRGCGLRFR